MAKSWKMSVGWLRTQFVNRTEETTQRSWRKETDRREFAVRQNVYDLVQLSEVRRYHRLT